MKRWSIIEICKLLLLGCCLFLVAYGIYIYTETPRDTSRVRTEASLSSIQLMSSSEDSTIYQYLDKAIEIESVIKEISIKDGVYTLLLNGNYKDTFIICEMQKNQNLIVKKLNTGDRVVIKGVFKGFLKDAVLLNCVITY